MPGKTTRRTFLKQLAAGGTLMPLVLNRPLYSAPAPRKLRHACIGVGNMGWSDLRRFRDHPNVEIVALCDVDTDRLIRAASDAVVAKKHPGARTYLDWRVMLAEEGDRIESVNISTPDHMHAPIAMTALRQGKHVFCQKPLAHDVWECRKLAQEAESRPRQVTQMCIQIHSHVTYRMGVRMIQTGMIGKVKEVHSWCGKGWVGPPKKRPTRKDPVPGPLDWELWLGTAPHRPYVKGLYHPQNWRRWIDFGTGTLGDMACHIMDPVFCALDLTAPDRIQSVQSPPFEETYSPNNMIIFEFPGTNYTVSGKVTYTWYDSGCKPDRSRFPLAKDQKLPTNGSMFVGEEGCLLLPHWAAPRPLPRKKFLKAVKAFKKENEFPRINHFHQYVDACLGKGTTSTPFSYSGPLTEAALLGLISHRFRGERLRWDSENLRFPGKAGADSLLRRIYRGGWEVDGLG